MQLNGMENSSVVSGVGMDLTSLHVASEFGWVEVVNILLEVGQMPYK